MRANHWAGERISARLGKVSGEVQTLFRPSMPTAAITCRQNSAPSRYCRILASRPSTLRMTLSKPWPCRRTVNFARICSTVGMTSGPTPSITTSAWPSSSDMTAVMRSMMARWAGVWTRSTTEISSLLRSASRIRATASPSMRSSVQLRGADNRIDLRVHVLPQPGNRGELNAVRLLVQADPEPEVGRIDLQLTLDRDDVRGNEQQPTAGLTFGSGVELVELAEHLGREVAEQRAHLHASDPRADLRHGRVGSAQLVRSLGSEGSQDLTEAVEVRLNPPLAVHHQHRRGVARRFEAGHLGDVGLGPVCAVP